MPLFTRKQKNSGRYSPLSQKTLMIEGCFVFFLWLNSAQKQNINSTSRLLFLVMWLLFSTFVIKSHKNITSSSTNASFAFCDGSVALYARKNTFNTKITKFCQLTPRSFLKAWNNFVLVTRSQSRHFLRKAVWRAPPYSEVSVELFSVYVGCTLPPAFVAQGLDQA